MDHCSISNEPLLSPRLHDTDDDYGDVAHEKLPTIDSTWFRRPCGRDVLVALACVSLPSLILNIILVHNKVKHDPAIPHLGAAYKSAYTGLSLDTPSIHYHHTDYWSTKQTVADDLWESIDTNPMVVALTDGFVDSHGLPRSDRFPWDENKGGYFVKVFHQLHCLKFIRRAFVDYQCGPPGQLNGQYVHHCLDTLRQDVTCMADDTPMPTGEEARAISDEQPMTCKNFGRLVEWVYAPERHACHRALDDYRSITHSIERYAFCEPGSENFGKMKEYFDKYGHVDPWI